MRMVHAFSIACVLFGLTLSSTIGTSYNMLAQGSYGTSQVLQHASAIMGVDPQPILSLNSSSFEENRNLKGSIQTFPTIMQAFKSRLNYTLTDAATIALNAVGRDALAVSSALQSEGGFLVYNIILIDARNELHRVIIDAGNGSILADSVVPPGQLSMSRTSPGWPPMTASPPAPPPPPPPPHGGGFVLPVPPSSP